MFPNTLDEFMFLNTLHPLISPRLRRLYIETPQAHLDIGGNAAETPQDDTKHRSHHTLVVCKVFDFGYHALQRRSRARCACAEDEGA